MGRRMVLHLRMGSQLKSGHPSFPHVVPSFIFQRIMDLSASPSEEVLMQACFHCSFLVAADLTRAVQNEQPAERGGRRSPALACRLLARKERG